jgi:osmotically inducible protein OsmC
VCAHNFRAWEGGGEYNVARGLRRRLGLHTSIVIALFTPRTGTSNSRFQLPKNWAEPGGATNPEQLFTADYSACFFAAIRFAGQQVHMPVDSFVTANIGIGPRSEGGWEFVANLVVHLPGIDREKVEELIEAAHQICPYSTHRG